MKDKKNYVGWIIFVIVLIILFIPIISDYIKSQKIDIQENDKVIEKLNSNESYVISIGDVDKASTKILNEVKNKEKNDYSFDYEVINASDDKEITSKFSEDTKYAIIVEGDIQKEYKEDEIDELSDDVDAFLIADFNDKNISYKVAKDSSEFNEIVKSDEVTMFVFGRDTCGYCNLFKPVYNALAEKYDLDIYFFDSDSYNSDEYSKIIKSKLVIPGKCNSDTNNAGKDFKLSDGFGTPLTIFTKDNKVIDCISGYVDRASLMDKLKNVGMIEE